MATINYFVDKRGDPGALVTGTDPSGTTRRFVIPAMVLADGTGTELATATNPLKTVAGGTSNLATGQVAVTTSATLIAAARIGRSRIILTPTSNIAFYVGNTGVSATTGAFVPAGGTLALQTTAAVYAIGAANVTVSYIEEY